MNFQSIPLSSNSSDKFRMDNELKNIMDLQWSKSAWDDYLYWQTQDKKHSRELI